jgi:hypothetical protein
MGDWESRQRGKTASALHPPSRPCICLPLTHRSKRMRGQMSASPKVEAKEMET